MPSVRKIAAKLGVSIATVSRALNNHPDVNPETRAKVLSAASEAHYVPIIGKRLQTVIGLAYPGEPVRADYGAFESALLAGVMRGVNEHKFDVTLVSIQRDKLASESYSQFFNRKGLRGVILRCFENSRRVCEEIAAEGYPSVVVADRFENPIVNYISCDSRLDSRRAAEHLIHLGHRRVALMVHNVPDTDHKDRREAFFEAFAEHNIPVDPSLVLEMSASPDAGAAAVNRFMGQLNPPTAIYFTDPMASLGAMRRCLEIGLNIPGDLSIVGFDDGDIRVHTWPSLTAVCQDANMLGFEAAQWLTRYLSNKAVAPFRVCRQTMLEINRSTAPPSASPVRILPDGTKVLVGAGGGGAGSGRSPLPRVPGQPE